MVTAYAGRYEVVEAKAKFQEEAAAAAQAPAPPEAPPRKPKKHRWRRALEEYEYPGEGLCGSNRRLVMVVFAHCVIELVLAGVAVGASCTGACTALSFVLVVIAYVIATALLLDCLKATNARWKWNCTIVTAGLLMAAAGTNIAVFAITAFASGSVSAQAFGLGLFFGLVFVVLGFVGAITAYHNAKSNRKWC
jgi:hypothetical protein